MQRNEALEFSRDFAELLSKYGVTLEQIKSGQFFVGPDEVYLNTLAFDQNRFSIRIVTGVSQLYSQRIPRPFPNYVYAGDKEKHLCPYCWSSRRKMFWGRSEKCINPQCFNYFQRGFEVLPVAKKEDQENV